MNKMMIGSAVGFAMGVGLMMTPMGRTIRKDMRKGMCKARQMMNGMSAQGGSNA